MAEGNGSSENHDVSIMKCNVILYQNVRLDRVIFIDIINIATSTYTAIYRSPCQRDEEYQHATILQWQAEVHHLDQRKPITSLPLSIYVKIPSHAVQLQR